MVLLLISFPMHGSPPSQPLGDPLATTSESTSCTLVASTANERALASEIYGKCSMSALPPKADIWPDVRYVRLWHLADIDRSRRGREMSASMNGFRATHSKMTKVRQILPIIRKQPADLQGARRVPGSSNRSSVQRYRGYQRGSSPPAALRPGPAVNMAVHEEPRAPRRTRDAARE